MAAKNQEKNELAIVEEGVLIAISDTAATLEKLEVQVASLRKMKVTLGSAIDTYENRLNLLYQNAPLPGRPAGGVGVGR